MQGLRSLFLLRSRLAPKQTSASRLRRRNSLRASGLHHSKKTMKTGWRGPCPYKPIKPIRLTCPLRAADLTGSGHQCYGSVFKVFLCVSVIIRQRRICRVRRYFLVHHIEHPIKRPTPKTTQSPTPHPLQKKEGGDPIAPKAWPQRRAVACRGPVGRVRAGTRHGPCRRGWPLRLCETKHRGADNLLTSNSFRLASSKFQLPKAQFA